MIALPVAQSDMTVAEYLADRLYKNGIRFVYGIPGGPSIPYMEAFKAAGIEFILTSNEAAAGIMADVTGRLTKVPGVCHSTFGPGATNLSTGIAGALLDRSPVIVLTSEIGEKMINRTTQMNINHQKLYDPLTKATFRLSPENTMEVVQKAFDICTEEYPGPVHIGLPSDIAESFVVSTPSITWSPNLKSEQNDIKRISELLEKSRRPLIAAGLTAARHDTGSMLERFLAKYKIPVVLTPMAKGLISEDNPCYAGVLFHSLSDYLEDIFDHTDLVIGIGYDPVEYNYESWIPDVPVIHFNTIKTDMPDEGDFIQFSGQPHEWFNILNILNQSSLIFEKSSIQTVRDEISAVFNGFTDHFGPVTALKVIQEELPTDGMIAIDVGSHLHLAGQYWQTQGRRNILMTNGWSGMGFGIPAALACNIVRPSTPAVCLTGDGGFLMMAGEIMTARRYNLPLITIVFSDGELNLIKLKQSWKNLSPYATRLYSGDMFETDVFFGIDILTADSDETMRMAVKDAFTMKRPVIINARIDPDDYNWLIVRKQS